MNQIMLVVCLSLLTGCSPLGRTCLAYAKVEIASSTGYVSEARAFFNFVDNSLPDGQCAVAERILNDRDEPYSDMFPHQESLAATP